MNIVSINKDYLDLTVGKIVAEDYRKAIVFRSYGIDFCCGGKVTLEQACLASGTDPSLILNELKVLDMQQWELQDFNSMRIDELISHIVEKHHRYTQDTVEKLAPLVDKVARVHGDRHPELCEIQSLFRELAAELIPHMQKEEIVLFPAIQALINGASSPFNGVTIQDPISMMETEHDVAGAIMKEIRKLSNGFTLPKGACATYTVVYRVLEEFESDLHQHIHLENNILFPKVVETKEG